jgi:hypothetical protein
VISSAFGAAFTLLPMAFVICKNDDDHERISDGAKTMLWTSRAFGIAAAPFAFVTFAGAGQWRDRQLAHYHINNVWNCSTAWYVKCIYDQTGTTVDITVPPAAGDILAVRDHMLTFIPASLALTSLSVMFVMIAFYLNR